MNSDPSHLTIMLGMFGVQVVTGIGVGIIGFFIKRSLAQIDNRLASGDSKFTEFAAKIEKLQIDRGFDREYFAKTYVDKDDFIRDMRCFDSKIDILGDDVKKLLILSGGKDGRGEI